MTKNNLEQKMYAAIYAHVVAELEYVSNDYAADATKYLILDKITKLIGAICTVEQFIHEQEDMTPRRQ
jgi:hypothetical protein